MARGIALPAKLVRPIQAGTFQRTRLFRVLDARPITWVSGPPGSGKTTLAASYVEARRLRALWYQLDEADADVATLFFYLRQSALRASPTKRWRLPLLRPEYLSGLETFARRWFEELFAGMPPPFALVFDNYHTVPADSRFHEVLRTALETLPPEGRVIVTSRLGPPAAFARLCAEARMGFVEWDALRVTASEAAGIARARAARRVSRAEANALHAATDGWAAGVVLIVQRGSARNEETVPDRRPREAVFHYFASEVLAGSDDETKRVLLETALFTKITAAQAISLTGVQAASGILAGFAERRFFVDFHPEPEPTYQYHPLFREFLLSRARDHLPAGRREQLRTIAADLLERSGQIEEAAELVRESNDHHRLAKIALAHAPALLATGRGATLERWLSALPDRVLDASPWLLNWSAVCRMPFAAGACVRLATRAFERFGSDGDRGGRLFAASTAVDAILYHWMDFTELDRWIAALQQLLAASDPHSGDPLEVQAVAALFGALSWRCLEHPEIARWADRAEALWRTTTDVALRARLAMTVICYWISRGHVARSRAIFDELHASLPNDEPELGRLWRIAVEATLSWHEADYARSRRLVAKGLALAQTSGIRSMNAMLIGARAYCELIACDLDSAAKSLAESRASTDENEMVRIGHQHYLEGWKAFLDHDLPAAHAHAVAADRLAMQGGFGVGIIAARLALAQTLYERGESEEARLRLADALQRSRAVRAPHMESFCLLAKADFDFRAGDPTAGLEAATTAFALGREHGFLVYGWWRRDLVARVCARALEAGIEIDYARRLVRVHRLVPPGDGIPPQNWPWCVRIRALGEFEIEVQERPIVFAGRAQRKPLELLKVLVAFGGRGLSEQDVTDALWPETDGDLAQQSLGVTLHRLRRLLGAEEVIRRHQGRVDLDPGQVWTDVAALRACLEKASHADPVEGTRLVDVALRLYRGPLLACEQERWIAVPRERIRARLARELLHVAQAAESSGDPDRAIARYLEALDADDSAEEVYRGLMALYSRLGRRAELLALYQRCRATLAATLGVGPSPETEAVLESARRDRPH